MKKHIMKCVCLFMVMVMAFGCCTTMTFAKSKSIKTTAYEDCIIDGSNAYCLVGNAIWKVDLNTEAVTKVTSAGSSNSVLEYLQLKNGYLYFVQDDTIDHPNKMRIYRVKKSGQSKKKLVAINNDNADLIYAIKGKKIYYTWQTGTDYEPIKTHKKKMNLNGSKKKGTSTKVKYKSKKSNKSGYKVFYQTQDYGTYYEDLYYLHTPQRDYFITSIVTYW